MTNSHIARSVLYSSNDNFEQVPMTQINLEKAPDRVRHDVLFQVLQPTTWWWSCSWPFPITWRVRAHALLFPDWPLGGRNGKGVWTAQGVRRVVKGRNPHYFDLFTHKEYKNGEGSCPRKMFGMSGTYSVGYGLIVRVAQSVCVGGGTQQ